jgi:hypothetical protein
MSVSLVLPAQVRLGVKLEATATLTEVTSDRMLLFAVQLKEGQRVVATGEHKRLLT